jgi:transcriptional regulator with XRE-family HTH domain
MAGSKGLSGWDKDAMRRIRAHIRERMADGGGISQNEIAKRCLMTSGTLSKIMTEDRGVKVGMVLKLLIGLGVSGTKLLEENPDPKFFQNEPVPTPLRKIRLPRAEG